MDIAIEELSKQTKKELELYCSEKEIDISNCNNKQDILETIEDYYFEKLEEDSTLNKPDELDDSSFLKDEDDDLNDFDEGDVPSESSDWLKYVLTPQFVQIRIRKKLLNERYDYTKNQYFRTDKKRPLVSKSFANIFEAQILSVLNAQGSMVNMDPAEIRTRMRRQLQEFNKFILNHRVNPLYQVQIFRLYENLMIIGYKLAQNGWLARLLKDYNSKQPSENMNSNPNPNGFKEDFLKQS